MMEAVRTSETSVDNHFTRQYNPEDSSEHQMKRSLWYLKEEYWEGFMAVHVKTVSGELNTVMNYTVCMRSRYSQSNKSSQDQMTGTLSQNGGKLTLQKDNLLAAWRLSEKGNTQIKVAW
jgi:hypothetical protein